MFQNNMEEANSKKVEIEDVVEDMLLYIYTGNTNTLSQVQYLLCIITGQESRILFKWRFHFFLQYSFALNLPSYVQFILVLDCFFI